MECRGELLVESDSEIVNISRAEEGGSKESLVVVIDESNGGGPGGGVGKDDDETVGGACGVGSRVDTTTVTCELLGTKRCECCCNRNACFSIRLNWPVGGDEGLVLGEEGLVLGEGDEVLGLIIPLLDGGFEGIFNEFLIAFTILVPIEPDTESAFCADSSNENFCKEGAGGPESK